ncbi:MAG: hypothetical protein RLZZ450_2512, partial [Pseudomonadota bacterium]
MWQLENRTPYGTERGWTRDKNGVHVWVVAMRASFAVSPQGKVTLVDEQPPPVLAPEYHGDPGTSSLRLDSDLLYAKPATDVLLDATAHAPMGRKVAKLNVVLRVASITKQLTVYGDRAYYKSFGKLAVSDSTPFSAKAIRYESAYGGMDLTHADPRLHRRDARNPVGRGVAIDPASLVDQPAHSIEYPRGDVARAGPAGLGPIDAAWSPRRERAGTYDAAWQATRRPLLAEDYQDLYGSSAPDDQRVAHLRGGELVELTNLTPEGHLQFRLPKIYPAFTT